MTDEDLRLRMAELVVEALEVGTGKRERDVINELFDSFGLDINELDARYPRGLPGRIRLLRKRAASSLAGAAPTAAALLNEIVRCGGRFVAMLDEVYARLSQHTSTTEGTSETFRLERGGVDEEQLTISPAFIEKVRHLSRFLRTIEIGRIDEDAVGSLIGWDGGESYGHWPVVDRNGGFRLTDAVLHLAWITPAVDQRASQDTAWARIRPAVDAARISADRMVAAAERLVRAHVAYLDMLLDADAETAEGLLFSNEPDQWRQDEVANELEHFRTERVLAHTVPPGQVTRIDEWSAVGLRSGSLEPVVLPIAEGWRGTGISSLAGFAAMWRLGLWPVQRRSQIENQVLIDPATLTSWLDRVKVSCDQAAAWLANDVFTSTGSVEATELLESIEEFLNLPLWRQRHLLYEVWVLCATLNACEQASWVVELRGLIHTNGIWTLSVGPSANPVATLRYRANPAISLDIWREPNRATTSGVLTPDVTVSTPSPHVRDLLVVEAKDRQKMSLGRSQAQEGAAPTSELRTALGVARRYANGLRPLVTWVCNHCDFRQDTSASTNHGDIWTRIHVAAQFRPGNVPAAFTESVRAALAPPPDMHTIDDSDVPRKAGLILVADVTSSMSGPLNDAFTTVLKEPAQASFGEFRAVLYSDHGDREPFLVRKVGPFRDLPSLIDAVRALAAGGGGDREEALEDAMQRCRELVDDIGPQCLLVLTDAPPHPVESCPYRIDFRVEARALLDSGCHLQVANDWLDPQDQTWSTFQGMAGFRLEPLRELLAQQAGTSDSGR